MLSRVQINPKGTTNKTSVPFRFHPCFVLRTPFHFNITLYIFKILLRHEPCYKQQKTDIICLWIYTIEHPLSEGSNYLYYIKIYSVMKNCITGTFFLSLLLTYEGGWPQG